MTIKVKMPPECQRHITHRIQKHLRMIGLKTSGERFGQLTDYVLDMYKEGIDLGATSIIEHYLHSEPTSETEH